MIVTWLLGIGDNVSAWLAGMWPDWTPPDFLVHFDTTLNGILHNLDGVSVWADWPFMLVVVALVLGVWATTAGVKLVRAIASYLPFVGGAG